MTSSEPKRWPPPPDLESIRELVRTADPEGHLADGAPADEYEPEEEAILQAIGHLETVDLVAAKTLPIIQEVWQTSFHLDQAALAERHEALVGLANSIERFFGPQAAPQVRAPRSAS